jgi:hypothetical protein
MSTARVLAGLSAAVCRSCGKHRKKRADGGWHGGRGLCTACYHRSRRAGFPAAVPPRRHAPFSAAFVAAAVALAADRRSGRAGRLEDYADLRSWGATPERAAERVGITLRTAERYESAYQQSRQKPSSRKAGAREGRIADYAELTAQAGPHKLTHEQATQRMGVHPRTAEQYRAELRQREGSAA